MMQLFKANPKIEVVPKKYYLLVINNYVSKKNHIHKIHPSIRLKLTQFQTKV